jgi:hypothetical protein
VIAYVRSVAAVLLGYVVFGASTYAFFRVSGQPAHAVASPSFMAASIAVGIVCALAGGYVAGVIAGRRPFAHALAMAVLIAIGATVSLISTLGEGSIWSQLSALALMAPCAALGGWLRARQTNRDGGSP